MSLLTRTKGYFVVICVLMLAFLGTFSWRLLYSSYDSSVQPKNPSFIKVRRFQDERSVRNVVKPEKSGSEVDVDKDKDELSESLPVDQHVNSHVHRLVKVENGQESEGSLVKFGQGSNEDEKQDSSDLSKKTHDSTVHENSQASARKHHKSGAPNPVHKILEQESFSVKSSDQVSDNKGPNESKPFSKDEISDLLAKIHELGLSATDVKEKLLSWQQGLNHSRSGSSNGVVMPLKISHSAKQNQLNSYSSDDIRKHQRVISPGQFRVEDKQSVINDFHVNGRARTSLQSNDSRNQKKPSLPGASPGVQTSNLDTRRDPLTRTEQNQKQREKYLQLLKEKFEMSKAQNLSVETRKHKTDSQISADNSRALSSQVPSGRGSNVGEHDAARDHDTMRTVESGRRPDYSSVTRKHTKSLYESMRSKYPSFETRARDDFHSSDEESLRPDFCRGCFDFNFKTIMDHPKLCKSSSREQSKSVFLLMLISSAPSNYHARTGIRQTWGAECRKPNSTLKCLFVIGLSKSSDENSRVQLENDHHQDILQFDFRDSYANLTYKTITSFKWATQNCYSASYVMKTDDDMYVNSHLIPYMLQVAPRRKFMGGSCWGSSSPNRDTSSKWFVSLKSFHKPKFPPMCSGTGYIMSIDVMRSVLFASRNVPFFHLEDVYVALCLQKYGVLPVNIMGFSNMFQEFGACFYKNSVMTSHQVPPELLEEFWSSMNQCPKANVSPSQLYIIMPYPETD